MRNRTALYTMILGMGLCACSKTPQPAPRPTGPEAGDTTAVSATVRFDIMTAGAVSPDSSILEKEIRTVQIFAYQDGALVAEATGSGTDTVQMTLDKEKDYSFYALANYPETDPPEKEAGVQPLSVYEIGNTGDLEGLQPMTWKSKKTHVGKKDLQTLDVRLERLTARIGLQIDRNDLVGLEITGLRLRNAAKVMHPFGEQRSRVTHLSDLVDGTPMTPEQLARLNGGEPVCFNVLENCQGTLLPENGDPWHKTPTDSDGQGSQMCTYLEVTGHFKPESLFDGELQFNFYLGKDSRGNFDIERGTEQIATVMIAGENKDMLGWEIMDRTMNGPGLAAGKAIRSRNRMSDLYVGQKVSYEITLSRELLNRNGGTDGLEVIYVPTSGGDISISTPVLSGEDRMTVDFTVTGAGSGTLSLADRNGKVLASLDQLFIQQPSFIWSEEPSIGPGEDVRRHGIDQFSVTVNTGKHEELYLYATDRQGYNLNDPESGYEASTFRFSETLEGYGNIGEHWSAGTRIPEEDCSGVFAISPVLQNDGKDTDYNRALAESYSEILNRITCEDADKGIRESISMSISIPPLDIRMIDCYYAEKKWPGKYFEGGWALSVVNRSRIPVLVDIWHMGTDTDGQDAVKQASQNDIGHCEKVFNRSSTTYIIDRYKDSHKLFNEGHRDPTDHIFAHREQVNSSYVPGALDHVLEFGDTLVQPIHEITTYTLSTLAKAESRDANSFHHILDITLNGETLRRHDLDSAQRHIWYFTCGYDSSYTEFERSTGIHCYSNTTGPEKDWKGLTPGKLMSIKDKELKRTVIELEYIGSTHQMYLRTVGGNPYNLTVDARVTATVESRCRDKQGHYAPHVWPEDVTIEKKGIRLGDNAVDIDPDRKFFKAMYNVSQTEYQWSTFKKQYTYPTNIRHFTVELKLSGKDDRAFPVEIRYKNGSSFPYRHWSDKNNDWYYTPGVPGQWSEEAKGYLPKSAGLYTVINWDYRK